MEFSRLGTLKHKEPVAYIDPNWGLVVKTGEVSACVLYDDCSGSTSTNWEPHRGTELFYEGDELVIKF